MSTSMSSEDTLHFIEDYRKLPVLWDTNHFSYMNKIVRAECLKVLGDKYEMNSQQVKNKIKSLRSYFSKEHTKVTKKKPGAESGYNSQWFAYKSLLFIKDTITPGETEEIGGTSVEEEEEQEASLKENCLNIKTEDSDNCQCNDSPRNECMFAKPSTSKSNVKTTKKDRREEDPYEPMQLKATKLAKYHKDESAIFGEMVATKVRKLSPRNRAIAQNRINNILFAFEMEELDSAGSLLTVESPTAVYSDYSNASETSPLDTERLDSTE